MSVMCATIISKLEKGKRTKLNDNDSDSEVLGKGAVKLNFGWLYTTGMLRSIWMGLNGEVTPNILLFNK